MRGVLNYFALYDRLGTSAGDILLRAITQPQRILGALFQSLARGNLLWALLLPFLALPLIRPARLLIAAPILLQHLLSWRSSEWTILLSLRRSSTPFVLDRCVRGSYRWDGSLDAGSRSRFVDYFLRS